MIINFDPSKVTSISEFLNTEIEKNKNEKYIMFIFNDIYEAIIDKQLFFDKYVKLMEKFNLPFAFYPYYIHFNKVMVNSFSVPSPKMRFSINKEDVCDVVNQTTYGMILIDVEKINSMNFKFSEKYQKCFYIQQLIEECYKNNLYFSTSWFLDVPKSSQMLSSNLKNGFVINKDDFIKQKEEFTKTYVLSGQNANDFIKKLSDKCKAMKQPTITINSTLNNSNNDEIIISNGKD